MSTETSNAIAEEILPSPLVENFNGSENDEAFLSQITNFRIVSATEATFNFTIPKDGVPGKVVVWDSLTVDPSRTPVYIADLPSGNQVTVNPGNLNFQQGVYTFAITAGDINTVGATQSILSGQSVQSGMSSIIVTNKSLNSINTVFNNPANVIAGDSITWVILREGNSLGAGNQISHSYAPYASSGVVPVTFPAGALKNGQWYNVVLNPGYTTRTFTAGYVFKYVVQ